MKRKAPSVTAPPRHSAGSSSPPDWTWIAGGSPTRHSNELGRNSSDTLDSTWDKVIATGRIEPDFTIDLHGETLSSAHARLNRSLDFALRQGARVILLITGKPRDDNPRLPPQRPFQRSSGSPEPWAASPTSRGVIRASIKDWLAASPHASKIAAIRNAHPRHGGAGALYLILRRNR